VRLAPAGYKELYGDKLADLMATSACERTSILTTKNWVIRYLVADTGSWLTGRLVCSLPMLWEIGQHEKTLHVKLRKQQIQDSPSIDLHKPVSVNTN